MAAVDVAELDRGDDRGRRRDGDVGVDEEKRGAAVDAAVEEDDRTVRGERRLFGKLDLDFALSPEPTIASGQAPLRGQRSSAPSTGLSSRRASPWRSPRWSCRSRR